MLSLGYLNESNVRWCYSYEIRILLEQSGSMETFLNDSESTHGLNGSMFSHIFSHIYPPDNGKEKYVNVSSFIGNSVVSIYI